MIVIGAGGHALEVLQILTENGAAAECVFYDDAEVGEPFRSLRVARCPAEVQAELRRDRRVVLALGRPATRKRLAGAMRELGGTLEQVRASSARVDVCDVELGAGLNLMHGVLVCGGARVGDGVLLNASCQVHHGVRVGQWAEVGPGALLLGDAQIGDEVSVGAHATILPGVRVGALSVVGAGAVVTRDVPPGVTVVGVPARPVPGTP